ncbi:MAG TPA: LysR family transcriptional regulator [Alphaproteobacteria bacterium]|jgi:DNA-binding transcriptional LysR family regulator
MDNVNDIIVFVKVVERQSFTAAARDLKLSTSAVSRHITQLEESLGVQLIRRSTRRMAVTEIGEGFYHQCAKTILELERARNNVIGYNDELKGLLRVHATLGVGQRLVAPAVTAFLEKYTELKVDLKISAHPVNLLENGLDVVIRSAGGPDGSLDCRELGPVRYSICAAPGFLARGVPAHPRDLAKFNCLIHAGQPSPYEWTFQDGAETYAVTVDGSLRTNNGVALHEAAKGGLGIAQLPDYAAWDDVRDGSLVELFSDVAGWGRSIKAFYPHSPRLPAKLSVFLDFIEDFMRRKSFRSAEARERVRV